MKKALFITFALTGWLLVGCADPTDKQEVRVPVISQDTITYFYGRMIRSFTYKGCEYLQWDRSVTHKGNCCNPIHYPKK